MESLVVGLWLAAYQNSFPCFDSIFSLTNICVCLGCQEIRICNSFQLVTLMNTRLYVQNHSADTGHIDTPLDHLLGDLCLTVFKTTSMHSEQAGVCQVEKWNEQRGNGKFPGPL